MLHKIQPQQIQLHSFASNSGDLIFTAGETSVNANISRQLTGDFLIDGSLKVNGIDISVPDSSNTYSGDRLWVIGGVNNDVYGAGNLVLNSDNSTLNGSGNLDLNCVDSFFGTDSIRNTILAGKYNTIPAGRIGATLLKDNTNSSLEATKDNSFAASFTGGYDFYNGFVRIQQNAYVGGNFYLAPNRSGVISGDLHVLGNIYNNGATSVQFSDLNDLSGNLNTKITNTGQSLLTSLNSTSGALNDKIINSGQYLYGFSTGISGNLITTGQYLLGLIVAANDISGRGTGSYYIDNVLALTWANGRINELGRIDSFSSGTGGAGGFTGNGINGSFAINGSSLFNWTNGLFSSSGAKTFNNVFTGNGQTGSLLVNGINFFSWNSGVFTSSGNKTLLNVFTGNANTGSLKINNQDIFSWNSGVFNSSGNKSYNFLTGTNGGSGSLRFQTGPLSSGTIAWNSGLISNNGDYVVSGSLGGASLPIGSGDYVFPPSGWEEFPMTFIDTDGFLRTKIFLTKI